MAKPAVLTMISGASTPTVSNTFVNNNSEICTLQISGTFTSATVKVEGIVDINSGRWVSLATFDLTDLDLKTNGMSDKSLYRVSIVGILRIRVSVTAVSGGNITVMANFVGTSFSGEELPPSSEVPFTAYDLAVLGGYTGTQGDYEAALANVINVGPLAEQAATSASDAQTSANTAAASASSARTYANNAASSASGAQTSATNAASSANSAASSAAVAQTAATSAGVSASNAQTSAANAGSSAASAQTSAGNASASASNAQTSAGNAAASASNAQTSATNAATSANSAATSAAQAANAVGTIAPAIVTQWLNDNVNPAGSAVVVDSSLSISGAAADAKVTGDKITDLTNAFNTTLKISAWTPPLTKGEYINADTGKRTTTGNAPKYARTALWYGFPYRIAVNLNNADYEYRMMYYTENGTLNGSDTSGYLGCSEFTSGLRYIPRTAIQFALSIRRVDQAEMTDAYVAEISAALSLYIATDITLTERGMAADARLSGQYINDTNGSVIRYLNELGNPEFEPDSALLYGGGINSSGAEITDGTKIRTPFLTNSYSHFKAPFDAKFVVYWYSSTSSSGYQTASEERTIRNAGYAPIPQNTNPYLRIVLSKTDESAFTDEEIDAANVSFKLYNNYVGDTTQKKAYNSFKLLYNKAFITVNEDKRYSIVKGSMAGSSGYTSNAKYARIWLNPVINQTYRIGCPEGFIPYLSYYSSDSTANSSTFIKNERPRTVQSDYIVMPPADAKGFVVTFYATDHRDITDDDVATIRSAFMIYGTSVITETIQAPSNDSKTAFIAYMNQMCSKLGMSDSSFVDSSGLNSTNEASPEDELKLAIAVAGNYKATDIWSTKNRSFTVGGDHARTLSITSNVYGAESEGAAYKVLGGKGGSLTLSGGQYRKARMALYEVAGTPVAVSLMGPGEWTYNNIVACAQDLCAMMYAKMNDLNVVWTTTNNLNLRAEPSTQSEVLTSLANGTLLIVYGESDGWTHCRAGTLDGYVSSQYVSDTMGGNLAHLLTDGGGYAAVKVPVCSGAYLNAYTPTELLGRDDALSANASAVQTPASTTKTLTMLCALSLISDFQETIELVSSDISPGSGSTFYSGDKLILEDALRIMMMESSNTLATAIGRWVGRKLLANQYQRDGIYPSV